MDFDKVIQKRQSTRGFSSKKASWKDMVNAIEAVRQGPWADNTCSCKFLIIEEQKTIEKLADLANQAWIAEATGMIIVCNNHGMLEKMHGERGRIYAHQQAGAAINTLLLKLTDLGLQSCWVGSYDDQKIRELLDIPGDVIIEALIPVGYASKSPKNKPNPRKKPLETMLNWEKWAKSSRPALWREDKRRPQPEGFGY
jgi:nitroreductase